MRVTHALVAALFPTFACGEQVDFNTQIQPILSENC
jgi:hypothetical protein